jgi:mycothiol synthase
MTAGFRSYVPKTDFIRIRDFLLETYCAFDARLNWGFERWNYARYFVAPMLGAYGTDENAREKGLGAIWMWEDLVGVWEDDGEIVGVTTIEHPDTTHPGYGEIFVERHPKHVDLLDEMMAYGEERFAHPETGRTHIFVYEADADLTAVVQRRGYTRNAKRSYSHLEYEIGDLPDLQLPEGFRLFSLADECDVDKRRELFGRAFDHDDPREWPSRFAYEELMRAPDYRPELDLVIAAPDGTYATCCVLWYDEPNRIGHVEPMGTRPGYRKRGLARQILVEGVRRLQALGARTVPMDGGFDPFYEAFGFRKLGTAYAWEKSPG